MTSVGTRCVWDMIPAVVLVHWALANANTIDSEEQEWKEYLALILDGAVVGADVL